MDRLAMTGKNLRGLDCVSDVEQCMLVLRNTSKHSTKHFDFLNRDRIILSNLVFSEFIFKRLPPKKEKEEEKGEKRGRKIVP